jgi:hypothetical protein
MIKVYMDDERATPVGWYRTYTVEQTIEQLKTRQVSHLSLDNDLGVGFQEGYKVLDWLEEEVHDDHSFPIPEITIHSSNEGRKPYMKLALQKIQQIRQQQIGGS